MSRNDAIAILQDVIARVSPFVADARMMSNQLLIDLVPRAFVNASNAVVVLPGAGEPAATFSKPGSEDKIAGLVLSRSARRAA